MFRWAVFVCLIVAVAASPFSDEIAFDIVDTPLAGVDVPFTNCDASGATAFPNVTVTSDVYPFVRGKALNLSVGGELSRAITGGSLYIEAKWNGIAAVKTTTNLCTYSRTFKCPIGPGKAYLTVEHTISFLSPPGKYDVKLQGTDQDNKPVVCVTVSFKL